METLEKHLPFIKSISQKMAFKSGFRQDPTDLFQIGVLALLEKPYDENYDEAQIASYIQQRVTGAMLDHSRSLDLVTRLTRKQYRSITAKRDELRALIQGEPTHAQVAKACQLTLTEYNEVLANAYIFETPIEDVQELDFSSEFLDPALLYETKNLNQKVTEAINKLPERLQYVLSCYYEQELNLKEISEILGVTESRVCQLLKEAHNKLTFYVRNLS